MNLLLSTSFFTLMSVATSAQVYINEVADPADNAEARFVELFNPGSTALDISGYQLRRYANGQTTFATATIPQGTQLSPGAYYVIANNLGDHARAYPTAPPGNQQSFAVSGNGDDVYELLSGSVVLDVYGVVGVDGTGEPWEYEDAIVTRNNSTPNGGNFDVTAFTITPGGTSIATPGTANFNALPVSLVSFDATPAGAKANLKWVTASELDNAFFAVEVSRDGTDFTEAGRVDGAGTSRESATYGFTYPAPAAGRYYFRLAQHDFDGQVNYSPVVTAELGRGGKKFGIASATYRSDELLVDAEDDAQLRIIDMRGAVISTVKLGAGRQSIDVSGLPAGVYALTDGDTAVRFVR